MAWQTVGPGLLTALLNSGNFKDVESARKEIEALIFYGNLKTNIEKIA